MNRFSFTACGDFRAVCRPACFRREHNPETGAAAVAGDLDIAVIFTHKQVKQY